MTEKKPIGAPRGNQNARKHGFYSRVLDEAKRLQLNEAREVEGTDEKTTIPLGIMAIIPFLARCASARCNEG